MQYKHNKELVPFAKELRKKMTKEERHLWYDFLRGYPVSFLRQKVIGKFIVDFYCAEAKLVIELDGSQHGEAEAIEYDSERTAFLKNYGLTVLRPFPGASRRKRGRAFPARPCREARPPDRFSSMPRQSRGCNGGGSHRAPSRGSRAGERRSATDFRGRCIPGTAHAANRGHRPCSGGKCRCCQSGSYTV